MADSLPENGARLRPVSQCDPESGTALVMALIFIVVGSLLSISLADLSGANLLNSSSLQNQRNSEYAADAAMSQAIQSVRYYGSCEDVSNPDKVDGYFYFVSCSGTPMTVPVAQFSGPGTTTLTAPTGQVFVAEDAESPGLEVKYLSSTGSTVGFTRVSTYNSDGTLTVYTGPSSFPGVASATLFKPYGRIMVLSACVSTSAVPSSCDPTSTSPRISAVVHFSDIDSRGAVAIGYGLDVLHWNVKTTNG